MKSSYCTFCNFLEFHDIIVAQIICCNMIYKITQNYPSCSILTATCWTWCVSVYMYLTFVVYWHEMFWTKLIFKWRVRFAIPKLLCIGSLTQLDPYFTISPKNQIYFLQQCSLYDKWNGRMKFWLEQELQQWFCGSKFWWFSCQLENHLL